MPLNLALAGQVLASTLTPQFWGQPTQPGLPGLQGSPDTQGALLTPNSYASISDLCRGLAVPLIGLLFHI